MSSFVMQMPDECRARLEEKILRDMRDERVFNSQFMGMMEDYFRRFEDVNIRLIKTNA